MNDLNPNTEPILLSKDGTSRTDICVGGLHVHDFQITLGVRGLLCHRCNIRLGGWEDIAWREKAIQYLGLNNNPAS